MIDVMDMQMTETSFHNHFNGTEFNFWVEHKSISPSSQPFPFLKSSLLSEEGNTKFCFHLGEFLSFTHQIQPKRHRFFLYNICSFHVLTSKTK